MKKLRLTLIAAWTLAAFSLAAAPARAEPNTAVAPAAALFGDQGQWVFSISSEGEFPFRFSKIGGGGSSVALRPSADYFIAHNVSVGGIVALTHDDGGTNIGFGPRIGYDLMVTNLVSVWFRGGLFFDDESPAMGARTTTTDLGIQAPFLFHLVPHFFVGVGPFVTLRLQQSAGGTKENTLGLTAIVGGYL